MLLLHCKEMICVFFSKHWNSLPNKVVLTDSVNCFKSRLDKFWQNQDIVYNFRAEIEGTGSQSEV